MRDPIERLAELKRDQERKVEWNDPATPTIAAKFDALGQSWHVMHRLFAASSEVRQPVEAAIDDLAALTRVGVEALFRMARRGYVLTGDPVQVSEAVVRAVMAALDLDETSTHYADLLRKAEPNLTPEDVSRVVAQALREAADEFIPDCDPEDCTTIYDPWDVAEWLRTRADRLALDPPC